MTPSGWQEWLAWAGLALPLLTLAWAAILYVQNEKNKEQRIQYDQFFQLMEQIGTANCPMTSKIAAISELKRYPAYKDVIIRFCSNVKFEGSMTHMIETELDLTLRHFGHEGRTPSPHGGEGWGEGTQQKKTGEGI